MKEKKQPLTYISLFSSAGVGCYGFKLAGFDCIATNEILEKRIEIQKNNQKCSYNSGYICGDITQIEVKKKIFNEVEKWKKNKKIKELDVIIATPPCQGMSVANHKKNNEIIRNSLVIESIQITKQLLPKVFIFENVKAFLTTLCTDIDGLEKPIGKVISTTLAGEYNILSKIVNFKDIGSHSSRTRTLVIGVRKDIQQVSPYDLFPTPNKPKTLKQLISHLPPLKQMGEIDKNDIYHFYRPFDKKMLPWIEHLNEGESAFNNKEEFRIPHTIKDGKIVLNKNKNGDKYSRWYWDKVGPCIHTRNDLLASQSTIHPKDNRVFSIREIMLMMTVPQSFKWSRYSFNELNNFSLLEKQEYLKKEEMKIRQSLGEAVPTTIFEEIAKKIKNVLTKKTLSISDIKHLVEKYKLEYTHNMQDFIISNKYELDLDNLSSIIEYSNAKKDETSAYFTRKDIIYTIIKDLPNFEKKKEIRILEPSVGSGNFLHFLIEKYKDKESVIIDAIDIDKNVISLLKLIVNKLELPNNITLNLINDDFLLWESKNSYDLIIGNPPFKKITNNRTLLKKYKEDAENKGTNNLFSFFIEKSLKLGSNVALIVPKSLINAPEFNGTRKILSNLNINKICDYGELAFKGVKIETISFLANNSNKKNHEVIIESYIKKEYLLKDKNYIFSNDYPYWLVYRDKQFDLIANKMILNTFNSFRDRQITKALTKHSGKFRVLKSRNIGNNEIINIKDYDCFIDSIESLAVSKFLDQKNIVLIPNLTYNPRATFLPKQTITDGSVALLTIKEGYRKPCKQDLHYYNTSEFNYYYKVARNYGSRSLNIDNNSVYFFGLLKDL